MLDWIKNPRICTILGVPLHLHFSFILFIIYWCIYYPSNLVSLLVIFMSIILHEYGHVIAARYCGVGCKGVVLLPIGGAALLDSIPKEPGKELIITIAGPLVSLVLGIWGTALAMITFSVTNVFIIMAGGNLALFVFNCLPVFPMDGGRIFRALLHYDMSYEKATLIATRTGQGIALVLGVFGLFGGQFMIPIVMLVVALLGQQELMKVQEQNEQRA